jgi:hypothetical protein
MMLYLAVGHVDLLAIDVSLLCLLSVFTRQVVDRVWVRLDGM